MAQKDEKDSKKVDYAALKSELDTILMTLQDGAADVDVAMKHYERGLEIVKALETYLQAAENSVTKLKAKSES